MKKLLFFIILASFFIACGNRSNIKITGNVEAGIANGDSLYLINIAHDGTVKTIASCAVENNIFKLEGNIDAPAICNIVTYNKQGRVSRNIDIIAEGEPLNVTVLRDYARVTGSPLNEELQCFNDSVTLTKKLYQLYYDKKAHNPTLSGKAVEEADKVMQVTALHHRSMVYRAIERNINNIVGLHIIKNNFSILEPSEAIGFIESLPDEHKNDYLIEYMYKYYQAVVKYAVGSSYADFVLQDSTGTDNYLSGSVGRNKPVVVSLWASDNIRAINELDSLKHLSEEYTDKLSFIGVSIDTNRKQWLAAIQRVNPVGKQLTDFKGWQNAVLSIYGIYQIPYYILIDKNGIIDYRGIELKDLIEHIDKLCK